MSRTSFKKTAPEPVAIDQVFAYGSSYYRSGRFIVEARLGPNFWRTKELVGTAERNYTNEEILRISWPTAVQPGQFWEDDHKRVCTILKPIFGYSDGWKFKTENLGDIEGVIFERDILARWIRLDAMASGGARCPLCGGRGAMFFTSFECSTSTCRNYRRP